MEEVRSKNTTWKINSMCKNSNESIIMIEVKMAFYTEPPQLLSVNFVAVEVHFLNSSTFSRTVTLTAGQFFAAYSHQEVN